MSKRTGGLVAAGAVAVAAAVTLLPNAMASQHKDPGPQTFAAGTAAQLGSTLAADLGQNAAGWYFDGQARQLVVNVLDEKAAQDVRARGAVARIVKNSTADLTAATHQLSRNASVPGTAWSINPRTNKVAVIADRTVTGARMAKLKKAVDEMGGMVTVQRSAGEFRPFHGTTPHSTGSSGGGGTNNNAGGNGSGGGGAGGSAGAGGSGAGAGTGAGAGGAGAAAGKGLEGGDAIFGGQVRCSLGFNVTVQGKPAFLTAGHCGNDSKTWSADQAGGRPLGTVVESKFPVTDFALVKYDDATVVPSSSVDLQNGTKQQITHAAEASVGMAVKRSGSTTGTTDGTVTGLNATVNYGNGDIVNGLIQTNVCAEPGDSGGAMFSGDAAVGLTSGGSGDCTRGGETFFQPVTAALKATGAQIGADNGSGGTGGAAAGGADAGASAGTGSNGGAAAGGADAGANAGTGSNGGAAAGGADAGANAGTGNNGGAASGGADAGGGNSGGGDMSGSAAGTADSSSGGASPAW